MKSLKNNKAIICGSFINFHKGHLFLIKKALRKFNFIYIIIAQNPNKPISNKQQIYKNIEKILIQEGLANNTEILINQGLLANYIKKLDTIHLIRGYRNFRDLIYEIKLIKQYKQVNKNIIFHLYKSKFNLRKISSSNINND